MQMTDVAKHTAQWRDLSLYEWAYTHTYNKHIHMQMTDGAKHTAQGWGLSPDEWAEFTVMEMNMLAHSLNKGITAAKKALKHASNNIHDELLHDVSLFVCHVCACVCVCIRNSVCKPLHVSCVCFHEQRARCDGDEHAHTLTNNGFFNNGFSAVEKKLSTVHACLVYGVVGACEACFKQHNHGMLQTT